jgi:hypothetical protein
VHYTIIELGHGIFDETFRIVDRVWRDATVGGGTPTRLP